MTIEHRSGRIYDFYADIAARLVMSADVWGFQDLNLINIYQEYHPHRCVV